MQSELLKSLSMCVQLPDKRSELHRLSELTLGAGEASEKKRIKCAMRNARSLSLIRTKPEIKVSSRSIYLFSSEFSIAQQNTSVTKTKCLLHKHEASFDKRKKSTKSRKL